MDNKGGGEIGVVKGEVVDVQSGMVEGLGDGGETVRGVEEVGEMDKGEGREVSSMETDGGTTKTAVANDGEAGTDAVGKMQGDLVNLTTKDGEKIEKEWVNAAQTIVRRTRDNPREREEAVYALKEDFIEKRFGRKIGRAV